MIFLDKTLKIMYLNIIITIYKIDLHMSMYL